MSQETLGSGRSRRARKQVDYNFDQAFDSGDDVFEDDPPPTRTNSSSTKKKSYSKSSTPRKSTDFDFNSGSGGGGYGVSTGGTTYDFLFVFRRYRLCFFMTASLAIARDGGETRRVPKKIRIFSCLSPNLRPTGE